MPNPFMLLPATLFLTGVAAPANPSGGGNSVSAFMAEKYPRQSLALGEQGTVGFTVELDADARIDTCVVTNSSGYSRLDEATCDVIVRFARFPRAQTADGKSVATRKTGLLAWKLPEAYRQNAASAPARVSATPAQLEEMRLICRRKPMMGSLIKLKTYCLTKREWVQVEANTQQENEKYINPYHTE